MNGFGTKKAVATWIAHAALFVAGVLAPRLQDLIDELCDAEHILVRFRGQAEHEVELHIVPAALKGDGAGIEDLLLRDILVDGVAQTLRPGLRREGQAALAHLLQPQHEIAGKLSARSDGSERLILRGAQ